MSINNTMMITAHEVRVEMMANTAAPIMTKDYKLKLSSKKLKSGKCQVKFHATMMREKQLYGYILVDADETLKQVVDTIKQRLDMVKYRDTVHHINLYAIGKHFDTGGNFLVFDA